MANEIILIGFLLILLIVMLVLRIYEIFPQVIFMLFGRGDFPYIKPDDIGFNAELVDAGASNSEIPIHAYFFSADSDIGILMVPNWFLREDFLINLKTAGILQELGYNVLLPLFHDISDSETSFQKKIFNPRKCQQIIQASFEYCITDPRINKRKIGVYSSSFGTVLASRLIKNQPIKAAILENGPVDLWNKIAGYLQQQQYLPFNITKVLLVLFLWPFLWRTDWQSQGVINNLRACPTFLIGSREDQTFSRKYIWRNFNSMYLKCPRKLWFEHTLFPTSLCDTWNNEYRLQIRNFYDPWLVSIKQPDFHYHFIIKEKRRKKYLIEIRVTVTPPQMEDIPLQIMISDKGARNVEELRILFNGASMIISYDSSFKPNSISLIPFWDVTPLKYTERTKREWKKNQAREALVSTIEQMLYIPLQNLETVIDKYFFLKAVLFQEQEYYEEAQEILNTSLNKKYWKRLAKFDGDSRAIFEKASKKSITTTSDDLFHIGLNQ